MTETTENKAEDTLVNQLASPMIKAFKKTRKFNSRNRSAWKRMNRPSKMEQIDSGASKIHAFLGRAN